MNTANNPSLLDKHLRATLLGTVGEAAFEAIRGRARIDRFKVPTLLCAAGDMPTQLHLVVQGSIALVARRPSGEEFVISYVTAGGWATWLNCFMDAGADFDFYTSDATTLISIPTADIRSLCAQHPTLYPLVIQHIGRRMRLVLEWTAQSALAPPSHRMAKLLHTMATEQLASQQSTTLCMTQARLAGMARCSRQTANKLIAELEGKGLVVAAYGRYEIPDLEQLAAYAAQAS